MIDFAVFMVFSVLEVFATYFLIFCIFKIDIYAVEMIFAGLIMSFFSYILRTTYSLTEIDILVQYFLLFAFMWLLFRIHFIYAVIMTGMTYPAYMLVQSLLYLLMIRTGLFPLSVSNVNFNSYLLQFVSSAIAIGLGTYIKKMRKGFDFVPDKSHVRIKMNKHERLLFALTLPSVLVVLLTTYFASNLFGFFLLIPAAYAILLFGYLYYSYKKDRGEHRYFSS